MEQKGFIRRVEEPWGNKKIIKYNITEKGKEFCKRILEPYEEMFSPKVLISVRSGITLAKSLTINDSRTYSSVLFS